MRALYEESAALPYEVFLDAIPAAHMSFFRGLELFHQNTEGLFVHAGIDPDIADLDQQAPLLMGCSGFVDGHCGPPIVVYGHRNNADVRDG